MAKLQWDNAGQRFYHNGISKVILFPTWDAVNKRYTGGVAWNGITGIDESPDGGDSNDLWADNIKYGSLRAVENLKGTISAYQWPDEFEGLDGKVVSNGIVIGQQKRNKRFGICYRTEIGNDANHSAGYQLHFLYDVMISPSDKSYETINDSPDATEFSWDFECLPQKHMYSSKPTIYSPLTDKLAYDENENKLAINAPETAQATYRVAQSTDSYALRIYDLLIEQRTKNPRNVSYTTNTYASGIYVPLSMPDSISSVAFQPIYNLVNDSGYGPSTFTEYKNGNGTRVYLQRGKYYSFRDDLGITGLDDTHLYNSIDAKLYLTGYIQTPNSGYEELHWHDPAEVEKYFYLVTSPVETMTRTLSSVTIDSRTVDPELLSKVEAMMYDGNNILPSINEILN